jgi:fructose-bisphosphate aldolase class II
MQVVCKSRYESFGTAGNASKLKPLPLTAMAGRYNSGELEQKNQLTFVHNTHLKK